MKNQQCLNITANTTQTQYRKENIMETQKMKKTASDPIFINTPTGTVAIWGHEHISKRMLEVLGVVLTHDAFETVYHGVKSVVFRTDGYPKSDGKSICANFSPDSGAIAINMEHTLDRAIERSVAHPSTSIMAAWWLEMLLNFGHEVHHAVRWDTNRDELHNEEKKREEEETRAEDYSIALLSELVQNYDIEPPMTAEEPWFNEKVGLLPLTDTQKLMLSDGHMWVYNEVNKEEVILHTFKDFICMLSNGDTESEEWNKDTIQANYNYGKVTTEKEAAPSVTKPVAPIVETVVNPGDVCDYAECIQPNEDFYDVLDEMDMNTAPATPATTPAPANAFNFNSTLQQQVQEALPSTDNTAVQIDMATAGELAKQVYMKIYNHIFTNCGPQMNSDIGFLTPEAVCSNPIVLTPEEAALFVSMNHNDINGRWCPDAPTTNGLLGKVMKNTKLPAYELNINMNGVTYKRLIIPQNPAKRNNGQLTKRAVEAQAGNAIMYIINKDDNSSNKWGPTIINGEYKAGS